MPRHILRSSVVYVLDRVLHAPESVVAIWKYGLLRRHPHHRAKRGGYAVDLATSMANCPGEWLRGRPRADSRADCNIGPSMMQGGTERVQLL